MVRMGCIAGLVAALIVHALAGDATIVSIAGIGPSQRDLVAGRAAKEAVLGEVHALFLDQDRNFWVGAQRLLVRIDAAGRAHPAVGAGTLNLADGMSGDQVDARFAPVAYLRGVARGADGSVYFSDAGLYSVRRLRPDGIVETVVPPGEGYLSPRALAFDRAGNLYFTALGRAGESSLRGVIVRVTASGQIDPLALRNPDGSPVFLNQPEGLTIGVSGTIYVTEYGGHRVLRIDGSVVTTLAGTGTGGVAGDGGPAHLAELRGPSGVAVASDGAVYITDTLNNRIRVVSPDGIIDTLTWMTEDGDVSSRLSAPAHILIDSETKALYVAEYRGRRVWKIESGRMEPVAGNGERVAWPEGIGDGGLAVLAAFQAPEGIAACRGDLFIADTANYRVRRIAPSGIIDSIAGNGQIVETGAGKPALDTAIGLPAAVACDSQGNVYIADRGRARIWRAGADGSIAAILGDGISRNPEMRDPRGIAVDAAGNVYVAERILSRLIQITPEGRTSILWSGRPEMDFPKAVAIDSQGRPYLGVNGGSGGGSVYRIDPGGAATLVFETDFVSGLAFGQDGTLYLATNEQIGRLDAGGRITWIAGSGVSPSLGMPLMLGDHGPPLAGSLNGVSGITVGDGGICFTQLVFNRVRCIRHAGLNPALARR